MTAQKDRITAALSGIGAAWAVTKEKCILPGDGFDVQPTYHIHPDKSNSHSNLIQQFTSLNELEDWIREQRPPRRRERRIKGKRRNITLPDEWVEALRQKDGSLQAAIERLIRKELE